MKKLRFFSLALFVLLLTAYGCYDNDIDDLEKQEFREIAWESLSERAKDTVTHSPREASVNLNDMYQPFGEPDPEPVPAVSVRFNTTEDAILGPIVIYIDRESKEILGTAPRF